MSDRVASLARRDWRDGAEELVQALTSRLRTPVGTQELRPIQAAGLSEAERLGGLFVHGRVGCGKTLLAALLATIWGAKRPLLLVPGAMVDDTIKAHREIRLHWNIPNTLRIRSYQYISHANQGADVNGLNWLDRNPCDALICDEGHKLRDLEKSSVARRVYRYCQQHPDVKFAVMSGTLSPTGDLLHYAHLLIMALRGHAPVPISMREITKWARALDGTGDTAPLLGARSIGEAERIFKERVRTAPGVIVSDDTFNDVPLTIEVKCHEASEEIRPHFQALRDFWQAPDGWTFESEAGALGVAALARQMASGFYYRHEPRPPKWYLAKRKAWTAYCNQAIELGRADSPGEIKAAIRAGTGHMVAAQILTEWEEAEVSFPMIRVQEWLCGSAIKYAQQWARPHGIIWVKHIEMGEMIERCTGLKFFNGRPDRDICAEDGSQCVIASIDANSTGKNLQYAFRHNLILDPPANGGENEQMLGRTHREGQVHPVTAEYYCSCLEHYRAVRTAIEDATRIEGTLSPQKMTNMQVPPPLRQDHPAWMKPQRVD